MSAHSGEVFTAASAAGYPSFTESAVAPATPVERSPRTPLTYVPLSDTPLPTLDQTAPPWPGEQLAVRGMTLHVRRIPGPVDPVNAVYVHGLGGSSTNWTDIAGQLREHASGVAVDLPGFGRSRPPEDYPFTLRAQADAVVALIRAMGDRPVHLLGNSMGGATSMIVAARHPDLVRTMTLISPAVPDLRPDPRRLSDPRLAIAFLPLLGARARQGLAEVTPRMRAEQITRLCFADLSRVVPHRLDEAAEEAAERLDMPWAGEALERASIALLRSWLVPARRSLWRLLGRIEAPTLVVWGTEDRLITVRKAEKTARLLPNGRLLVLPRTGHVAQLERPVSVARAVLGMWQAVQRDRW